MSSDYGASDKYRGTRFSAVGLRFRPQLMPNRKAVVESPIVSDKDFPLFTVWDL